MSDTITDVEKEMKGLERQLRMLQSEISNFAAKKNKSKDFRQTSKSNIPQSLRNTTYRSNYDSIFEKRKREKMPLFTYANTVLKEENEVQEAKKRARRITGTSPYKKLQCPHCATFNLIDDPDGTDGWLFCKKCGWNERNPYSE
jgi:hypothetical protein